MLRLVVLLLSIAVFGTFALGIADDVTNGRATQTKEKVLEIWDGWLKE